MRPNTTQKMLALMITLLLFSGFVWTNRASAWTATITAVGQDIEDTNVMIGVASEAQMSQPTPDLGIMNLYTQGGTALSEDIRQEGNMRYIWIIGVNPNGNNEFDPARTATLSWDPLEFGPGTYELRHGADESGAIVVADMKTTDSYVVEGIRFFTLIFTEVDNDDDDVPDRLDNCPDAFNPSQEDGDEDGVGNACDNCPDAFNPSQEDGDEDGVGNACDNCPDAFNPSQEDGDEDGVGNACDGCPEDSNKIDLGVCGCGNADTDSDGDGTLDCNDTDDDDDGMPDAWEEDYGFNPLLTDDASEDPDGDGYSNVQEYLSGTNPDDSASIPQPPIADAGSDQTVDEGVTVTLHGLNSSDADDGVASYRWEQIGEPSVELSDEEAALPTFTSPTVAPGGTCLTFHLTVTDNGGLWSTDACIVNVTTGANRPPIADVGADQTVEEGMTVTLDGSHSSDPDDGIDSYLWEQIGGPSVELCDEKVALPTFTSPVVEAEGASLVFELTVTDAEGLQSTDMCIVNIVKSDADRPPIANAGADQTVEEGMTVILDGSHSSDPDDEIGSYRWKQTRGAPVTLSNPTAKQCTFVAPPVGINGTTLIFQLMVEDTNSLKASDEISISVDDNGITGFPSDAFLMRCSTGEYVGIKVEGGGIVELYAINPATIPHTAHKPENMIYGLLDMGIKVDKPATTAKVTIYLPEPAPDDYKWYKYSSTKVWHDFSNSTTFNAARDQIVLTLIDGGTGDDDGSANSRIQDPSGLGTAAAAPVASSGGGGGGCFIATAAYGTPFEGHVMILRQFRDAYLLPTEIGRAFVDFYWKYSPPLADFIAKHNSLRAAVRVGLAPVVGAAYVALHTTTAQKTILVMVLLGLLTGTYRAVMRSKRRFKY